MSHFPGAENPASFETFEDAREILITHGHFDHLMSVPHYSDARQIRVHCTASPCETLLQWGMPKERIHSFAPGDQFSVGEADVSVYQGQHNIIDVGIAVRTGLRALSTPVRAFRFLNITRVHKSFLENGETVVFDVTHEGKRVLIMGSLGFRADVEAPPPGCDLLVLPYQGTSNPTPMALKIVETYQPKAVMLSHFDNAFPPMTSTVNTKPFLKAMAELHPEIPVCVPQFGQEVAVQGATTAQEQQPLRKVQVA